MCATAGFALVFSAFLFHSSESHRDFNPMRCNWPGLRVAARRRVERDGVHRASDVARLQQICRPGAVLRRLPAVRGSSSSGGGRRARDERRRRWTSDWSTTERHLSRRLPTTRQRRLQSRIRLCPTFDHQRRYADHDTHKLKLKQNSLQNCSL